MNIKNVTVNGQPVEQYLGEEKSKEIQEFIVMEIRMLRRGTHHHSISSLSAKGKRWNEQTQQYEMGVK